MALRFSYFNSGTDPTQQSATQQPTTQQPTTTQPTVPEVDAPPPTNYAQYNPYQQKADKFTGLLDSLGVLSEEDESIWNMYNQLKNTGQWGGSRQAQAQLQSRWQSYRSQMQGIESTLRELDMDVVYDDQGYTTRVILPDGRKITLAEALGYATGEIDRLGGEALSFTDTQGTFQQLENFFTTYGGTPTVDPFSDPNGWDQMIAEAFGELNAMPDTMDLMRGFYNLFPMQDYSADALPNLSLQERATKFFDDLRAQGFAIDPAAGGLDQQLRDQLYRMVMDMSGRIFAQLELNRSDFDKMSGYELAELSKIIGRTSVLEDKEMRQFVDAKMKGIRIRSRDAQQQMLSALGVANASYGGAAVRGTAELVERMNAEGMSVQADILMKSIEMAEQGKLTALAQLGQLTQTHGQFTISLAGLQNDQSAKIMDFAIGVANVSASEYKTKVDQQMAIADLELKANLGIAGLELDKYKIDRDIDFEQLKLDYSNYWQDRGMTFEEKEAEFNQAVTAWQVSATITGMVQSGQTDRLVQMMGLAIEAQSGNMEAWQAYQQMMMQQTLQNRGYDIEQSGMLADLKWNQYQLKENFNFQRWAIQNQALLERELAKLNADTQLAIAQMEVEAAKGGFWSDLANIAGGVGALVTGIGAFNGSGGSGGGGKNAAV